ncbi:MAG: carboxypeptidase regulatory-like domain-containing protein [Bacteroidia bacterium]
MVKDGKSDIKQGVFGKVTWMEGNFMPSTDRQDAKISAPAQRTVYIYALTKLSETEGQAPLFSKINKAVVAKVKTNKEGYFQCKLPPGKYSIFTFETESAQFFANAFDGDGSITPFEVKANEVTTIDININYKAFY